LLSAACQKAKVSSSSDSEPAAALLNEPVAMRMAWWGGESRHNATFQAIEAYQKMHPNVTIEGEYVGSTGPYLTKLLTQLAGNTAPDIIQVDFKWLKSFIDQKQNFVNLFDYASRMDTSRVDQGIINTYCVRDGFMLGLPIGLNALCINTNIGELQRLGIEFPKTPSWDDMPKMGRALQVKDPDKYLLWLQSGHYYQLFRSFVFQHTGNNPFNETQHTINFTKDHVIAYFTWLKELFDTKTIPPLEETLVYGTSFANEIPGWHEQRYLAASCGASTMATLINTTKFEVGVARWPLMPGAKANGTNVPVISMMFAVSSHSAGIDYAVDFINWYSNDDEAIRIMKGERGIPVNSKARDILVQDKLLLPQVVEAIELSTSENAKSENSLDLNTELTAIFDYHYQIIGYKKMTPEQTAAAYIMEVEKLLAGLKAVEEKK
jgi:oligogalacturonide transport system substrate-binding protein